MIFRLYFKKNDRQGATLIQSLFKESIDKTVGHVKFLLQDKNARDVKAILMGWGLFGITLLLQDAIKKAFPRLKIIIPKEASSAILRGAVIFGHNPTSITQRVLKKTYGVNIVLFIKCHKHHPFIFSSSDAICFKLHDTNSIHFHHLGINIVCFVLSCFHGYDNIPY